MIGEIAMIGKIARIAKIGPSRRVSSDPMMVGIAWERSTSHT
jgi:hypothetical protein